MAEEANKKKLEVTKDWYQNLLTTVYHNKIEERDLALDRYRRADDQMETSEHFVLMGKNAVSFLKQASDCTDSLADLAKELKSILYKENDKSPEGTFDDSFKRQIIDSVEAEEKESKDEELDDYEDAE